MSSVSSILRWLDGESPSSSARDDSQVTPSSTAAPADDIAKDGVTNCDDLPNDRSSVTAIEADLMEVSTKAVHAVKDWGSECCSKTMCT